MLRPPKLETIITSREKDLGGFSVRRILPYMSRRMVGPFIFFDHMGPAEFPPGQGVTVRPHPHINLATVTYLFDGCIQHRDSLGSNQLIEPGAINWMTAGRGIVHSERSPEQLVKSGSRLNGIQCWVALPEQFEEIEPSFSHHPKESLPEFTQDDARLKLLLGSMFHRQSPVKVHSDLFYLDCHMPKGARLTLPDDGREKAAYVVQGQVRMANQMVGACSMGIAHVSEDLPMEALEDSRLMLLGGSPVGQRFIYWNFVSSSQERLEMVKREWAPGPRRESERFQPIPGDDQEFIPLPEEPASNPKGTIM